MVADFGGIGFVVVGKTPIVGECVLFGLFGDSDFSRCNRWDCSGDGKGGGSFQKLTSGVHTEIIALRGKRGTSK